MNGATLWITGLSGSGKTTLANEVHWQLSHAGRASYVLDGDQLRTGLNHDLGFSRDGRAENVRRVGEVARLFNDAGLVAVVPLISPYAVDRDLVRRRHADTGCRFFEVYLSAPLAVCEGRDPKGLYARARAGELERFTGIDDPYEPPARPDLTIEPGGSVSDDAARLITLLD
jgi:bifunctional enzyme CysN/CysC